MGSHCDQAQPALLAHRHLGRRWQGALFRFALRLSGSAAVAEDVTQETFLALIRQPKRVDPAKGGVVAYLYGIARKQVLRRLTRERPWVPLADESSNGNGSGEHLDEGELSDRGQTAAQDPFAQLARRREIASVQQAVLSLPPAYREVVVLCELEELSYNEAAVALGCAVGTVRSRLHRGRALLARKLRGEPPALPEAAVRCSVEPAG